MITWLYTKIGDRQPRQIIEDLEAVIQGIAVGYTLEGDLMGIKIEHDEPENFEAVEAVDSIFPQYDEDDFYYRDDEI